MMKSELIPGSQNLSFFKSMLLTRFSLIRTIVVIIAFLLTYQKSASQSNNFLFRQITTMNGLSNGRVNCVVQDRKGFLWFGTEEGLNRFDGYEITVYRKILNDSLSLPDNFIYSLYVDSRGRLWIGTNGGLCRYDENKDRFISYIPKKTKIVINTENRITGIFENYNREIYVISEIGMLYLIKNDLLILKNDFHEYGNAKAFLIDKENNFWIGSLKGLICYNPLKKKVIHFSGYIEDGIEKDLARTQTIIEDGDTIWFGTRIGDVAFIPKSTLSVNIIKIAGQVISRVNKIVRLKSGQLYIGSYDGLFILNKQNELVSRYTNESMDPFGLNSNIVNDVYTDKQGNIWLATANGINLVMKSKCFQNYNIYSQNIKLDIKSVQSLYIDSDGNLLAGSYYDGMNLINLESGQKKFYLPDNRNPNSIGSGAVNCIFEDSKKNLWIGTYYGYLSKFYPKTGKYISLNFNNLSNEYKGVTDIRSMIEDLDGNLWFTCYGFGLFKFNPQTNEYKYFTKNSNDADHSLADNYAYQIISENDSIYWIATPSGLTRLNIITEKFQSYFNDPGDSLSISNDQVTSVFCDSNKNIWVGTSFGLDLLNRNNNSFYHFFTKDGLPNDQIKSFLEEKPGIIWIGTNDGLSRMTYSINRKTGMPKTEFKNFDRSDNLEDILFMQNSAVKSKKGKMFFGTDKGIIAFHPDEITSNTGGPDVYITELQLFNKKVSIGEMDSLLKCNIINTQEIKLKHNQNFLSFKYVALNYIAPERNQYAYKLEGFDADWNYIGTKHEAIYTNLPPGKYTFIVKASNNDGVWNNKGSSMKVIISFPWWKSWWFKTLLYLSVIALLFLIYYIRTAFYRNQQKKLQVLVKQRTTQLEEVASSLKEKQEEINSQKDELLYQRDKLEKANNELYKHRNQLESLVEDRTKELIQAKEKAEESDKLKSSFLANLSHEIRTPLNAIIGFSTLLTENSITSEERWKYNIIVQSSSDTLLELINDILDFSKIEAGQMNLAFSDVDIEEVLNDSKEAFDLLKKRQYSDADKQLDFKIKIEPEVYKYKVITDKKRLKQIISNLLSNALKFSNKGYVEIGCVKHTETNMLEFHVKDTGIGIKEKDQKVIFERFRKVEDEKSQVHRGTGLGLAISSKLIKLMGGTMWVISKYGKGSVFYFTIPCILSDVSNTLQKTVKSVNIMPDLENYEVLVAEDDQTNYEYIEILLKKTRARIIHARNGKEVLNILKDKNSIKLILMDIKMPVMDGIEALHEIQRMNIKIPVIAQSAYALADEIYKLRKEGFNEYISKPINPSEFYQTISLCMGKK